MAARRKRFLAVVALAILALLVAGAWQLQRLRSQRCGGCAIVHGGDGGGWPRAQPADEHLAGATVSSVLGYARVQRADALLVARHGHLLIDYPADRDRGHLYGSRGLATPLPALLDGQPLDARNLSSAIWQPLNNADALLGCEAQDARRAGACRLFARADDWLRLAQMILDHGRLEGEQVVPEAVLAGLEAARPRVATWLLPAASAQGAEPMVDGDGQFLRGEGRTRLWLLPSVDMVILLLATQESAGDFDETELPNRLLRGVLDRPPQHAAAADAAQGANDPAMLAPGH